MAKSISFSPLFIPSLPPSCTRKQTPESKEQNMRISNLIDSWMNKMVLVLQELLSQGSHLKNWVKYKRIIWHLTILVTTLDVWSWVLTRGFPLSNENLLQFQHLQEAAVAEELPWDCVAYSIQITEGKQQQPGKSIWDSPKFCEVAYLLYLHLISRWFDLLVFPEKISTLKLTL